MAVAGVPLVAMGEGVVVVAVGDDSAGDCADEFFGDGVGDSGGDDSVDDADDSAGDGVDDCFGDDVDESAGDGVDALVGDGSDGSAGDGVDDCFAGVVGLGSAVNKRFFLKFSRLDSRSRHNGGGDYIAKCRIVDH